MQNVPVTKTFGDLCDEALHDCGYLGIGSVPLPEDVNKALSRLQELVSQWQENRWFIYCLNTYIVTSTGQTTPYSIGPVGGPQVPQVIVGLWGHHNRPNRIEGAFFRQLVAVPNGPVDYRLTLLPSMEDYNKITLKSLTNFSLSAYYQASYGPSGLGQLYLWPWPQANIYQIGILIREMLNQGFQLADQVVLPWVYYRALRSNLALELRPIYGIQGYPGDELPRVAKSSLSVLRKGNVQIPELGLPPLLSRPGIYNIFSDTSY